MEDTGIDFLFLHNLRLLETLECHNELLYPLIHLVRVCTENVLEIFIGGLVDLLRALGRSNLLWEENSVLSDQILDLILHILGDLDKHIRGFDGEGRVQLKLGRVLHE